MILPLQSLTLKLSVIFDPMKLSFGGMKILTLKRAPLNHMTIQLIVSYISFFNWNDWPRKLGFQDQYLHPMQVTSSLDKKIHLCCL